MVIYFPVKFEFDWTKRFRVRIQKLKCEQTDGWNEKWTKKTEKWTGKQIIKQTELHQFRKEPSYDGDLCPCQVWIRLDKLFSSLSPETKMWTNRWMDKRTKIDKRTNRISPISKGIKLWWWFISLSTLNVIRQTIFELESVNQNVDRQTDGQKNEQKQTKGQKNRQMNGITPISKGT